MTFLVPFDDSRLSRSALRRATEFGDGETVVALSVVPSGAKYAREKGWLGADEPFAFERVRDALAARVSDLAPDATFDYVRTESRPPGAKVAKIIRRKVGEHEASVVFLGSENAGKVVTPVSSVASGVSSNESYDVYIARHRVGDG